MIAAAKGSSVPVLPISQVQADFLASDEPITAMVCGRGGGKTFIGSYRIITRAQHNDHWMAVSPDAGVSVETTVPTFIENCEKLNCLNRVVMSPYPRIWWQTFDGGEAQIVFRSAEKPDKLRGANKSGLWLDEASYQPVDAMRIARATLRRGGVMGATILTMTPRGRSHWTFELCYDRAEGHESNIETIQGIPYVPKPGVKLIQASTADNPFLPEDFFDSMAQDLSPLLAAQELGGQFIDIDGLMFRREWFEPVDFAPREALRVRYWDKAASTLSQSSFTAGVRIARCPKGIFYIEDVVRGQWSAADRDTVILQTAQSDAHQYGGEVLIYAEQEGGSGGKEVMQQMIKMLAGFPVYRDLASGSAQRNVGGVKLPGQAKVTRAQPLAAQAEAGNVRIVNGKWNQEFLSELSAFPESSQADQVDAASAGLNRLAALTQPEDAVADRKRKQVQTDRFGSNLKPLNGRGRRLLYNRVK
ncbi:MAG: phage terminase large subunit [Alphaproteobacteria bacterium]